MQRKSRNRMKIGIVSDSHKKIDFLKNAIKRLKKDGADFLVHAGDIVLKENLEILKQSKLPYQTVLGNNDAHLIEFIDRYNLFQEPHYFDINNLKVKLMHLPYYLNNDANMIVYGHTHHFFAEVKQNSLYINPGEICARKKPISEFAMVEVKKDEWIITHYQKNIEKNEKDFSLRNYKLKVE